jgi:hypothetical protein
MAASMKLVGINFQVGRRCCYHIDTGPLLSKKLVQIDLYWFIASADYWKIFQQMRTFYQCFA